jgi:uncharacterized protein YcbX
MTAGGLGELSGEVTALAVTAVKGTRVVNVEEIELGPAGARGDRRFFVIDDRGRMVNGKHYGALQSVIASYDELGGTLCLRFPDGRSVAGTIADGGEVEARFFSTMRTGVLVDGPWSAAISEHVGQPLRLVQTRSAVDRGRDGAASLISRASLERLAEEGGIDAIDARRFRMLIEIDGVPPHAEDGFVGHTVAVGETVIRFSGHVGRCIITRRDPDSGVVDLPTLDLLSSYRGGVETSEPLAVGIYGAVRRGGTIRLGDPVRVER